MGSTYQQDIEPAGRYLLHRTDMESEPAHGWEVGEITFKHPLVLSFNTSGQIAYDATSWKARLENHYGLVGKALTQALIRDGYDGIVTVLGNETHEIVDLKLRAPTVGKVVRGYSEFVDSYFVGTDEIVQAVASASPATKNLHSIEVDENGESDRFKILSGKRIKWAAEERVVKISADKIHFMTGNNWNFNHAAGILEAMKHGEVFEVPAARIHRISADDVAYTQKATSTDKLEYDYDMLKPWEKSDVGSYTAQLIDGNHRAVAALAMHEPYIYVYVGENYRHEIDNSDWN